VTGWSAQASLHLDLRQPVTLPHEGVTGSSEPVAFVDTLGAPVVLHDMEPVRCRAVRSVRIWSCCRPGGASTDWFETLVDRVAGFGADSLQLASVIGRRFPAEPMHLTDG
jgi:hypothetical protein